MAIIVPIDAVTHSRRPIVSNGVPAHLTIFIGANRYNPDAAPPPGLEVIYPMAFLVEQPMASVVQTHSMWRLTSKSWSPAAAG